MLLAPAATVVGWSRLTDPVLHVVTPLVVVLVFGLVVAAVLWGAERLLQRRRS